MGFQSMTEAGEEYGQTGVEEDVAKQEQGGKADDK